MCIRDSCKSSCLASILVRYEVPTQFLNLPPITSIFRGWGQICPPPSHIRTKIPGTNRVKIHICRLVCDQWSDQCDCCIVLPFACPPIYTYMAIAVFEVLEQGQHLESQPWCLSSAWLLFSQLCFVCSYIPFYCHMTIVLPVLYSLDYTTCVLLYVLHNIM